MKTRTVAYSTQMVSRVATMAGCRHHGSLRSVRSGICARVFAGASIACVILDVLGCLRLLGVARLFMTRAPAPAVPRRQRTLFAVELMPVQSRILPQPG